MFLRTKELMLPGVRSSLGASFLSSPCVLAATTAWRKEVKISSVKQSTSNFHMCTICMASPGARHIGQSSQVFWGQLRRHPAAVEAAFFLWNVHWWNTSIMLWKCTVHTMQLKTLNIWNAQSLHFIVSDSQSWGIEGGLVSDETGPV